MPSMMITAHSGCEGTPDNSLLSIQKAIDLHAECAEVDVRISADGALHLSHDALPSGTSAVSLADALSLIQTAGLCINCDLKEYDALYSTLRLAEQKAFPPEQLYLSGSVDVRMLLADPEIASRAKICLNSEELCRYMAPGLSMDRTAQTIFLLERLREAAALLERLRVCCLNAPYSFMPAEAIRAFRSAGIQLSLWTVDDPQHQASLLQEDLLNLTTRSPRSALELRQRIRREFCP